MYTQISQKQFGLYAWRDIWKDRGICVATGAIRTGKTEIGSYGFKDYAMELVENTPIEWRTKGYNLFTVISVSKSLCFMNIIEPMMNELLSDGYKECQTSIQFYKSKRNVFTNQTSPLGLLQIKDNDGNITRFIYVGADNKRALNRVTGLTIRGAMLDEAPLLGGTEEDNIKFIEVVLERMATFRVLDGREFLLMTTNPQDDDDCLFYQRFIKDAKEKGIVVLSFNLLDNPIFSQDDVEYYRKIFTDAQFKRKIEGKWVRDNGIATYPKFNRDRHIKTYEEMLGREYREMTIGMDEGQSDARAFVLQGFGMQYESVNYLDEFYYKNEPTKTAFDINDYAAEFWEKAVEWFATFRKPMTLWYDSAALYIVEPIKRYQIEHHIQVPVLIKPVNKASVYRKKTGVGSAIMERVEFTNILLGADAVTYSDRCKNLIRATSKCINKNGMRIDDGKTNMVDILDASEYAVKDRLKLIQDKLTIAGRIGGK